MAETDLWFGTLSATVRVGDLPASRRVVAIELPVDGQWRVCGAGASNTEGVAALPIFGLPTSRIYAVAIDEWGDPFVPNLTVAYGDVIRPTQFAGWTYQVTQPGVLPSTEPEWWNSMAGMPRPVGSAMMQAMRHYQPIAHGPVSDVEWEEGIEDGDVYWDKVTSLLQFEGINGSVSISDEKGHSWNTVGSAAVSTDAYRFGSSSLKLQEALIESHIVRPTPLQTSLGFTVEAWVQSDTPRSGFQNRYIFSNSSRNYFQGAVISIRRSGDAGPVYCYGQIGIGGGEANIIGAEAFPVGRFVHVALCYDGFVLRLFMDGRLQGTATGAAADSNSAIHIGRDPNQTGRAFFGFINSLRITEGVARYTESFTPPVAPFPNAGMLL